jgi:hypothetical protein
LTLGVLTVVAGMLVLANLTEEIHRPGADALDAGKGQLQFSVAKAGPVDPKDGDYGGWSLSYGWPLLWRQYTLWFTRVSFPSVLGECYSRGRLALNVVIWLVMLAVPGGACEWLLRRYRPRCRWSLRTMLAGIGVFAAICGWFIAARRTADVQDAVIGAKGSKFWVVRSGPRWLGLLGADRYRRRIVGANVDLTVQLAGEREPNEDDFKSKTELIARLGRLRDLQYLFIEVDGQTPGLAGALGKMRQLRALSISMQVIEGYHYRQPFSSEEKRISRECLAAIQAMPKLEHLSLSGLPVASENLTCLASLTNLKSLHLQVNRDADEEASGAPLLSRLPPLPRLEAVDLQHSYVGGRGLRYLSVLPRLKTVNLNFTDVPERETEEPPPEFDAGLAELAGLEFLQEAAVAGDMASEAGLKCLLALKSLKRLHIGGPYRDGPMEALPLDHGGEVEVHLAEIDEYRRVLDALRQANPGIVIDGDRHALDSPGELLVPDEYETLPEGMVRLLASSAVTEWKNGRRSNKAAEAKN